MKIIDFIPFGKENAISRAELGRLTGADDRSIRAAIKSANKAAPAAGFAILSSSGRAGYWKSSDPVDLESYKREATNRAKHQHMNDAPIFTLLNNLRGEQTIQVSAYTRRVAKPSPEMQGQMKLEAESYGEKII